MRNWRLFVCAALMVATGMSLRLHRADAARKGPRLLEAWPGRRVVLMLPLHVSDHLNIPADFAQALLPSAQIEFRNALEGTGKLSVFNAFKFNPVLVRAVQEKRMSQDELNNFLQTPSVDGARDILSKITFEQSPMVADFTLLEIRPGGTAAHPTLQVQVSGNLYSLDNPSAAPRKVIVTSDFIKQRGTTADAILEAAANAFGLAAAELVEGPEDLQLERPRPVVPKRTPKPMRTVAPRLVPTPTPAPQAAPTAVPVPTPTPVAVAPQAPLPGPVMPGAGGNASNPPVLPHPAPPLGITVPQTPANE